MSLENFTPAQSILLGIIAVIIIILSFMVAYYIVKGILALAFYTIKYSIMFSFWILKITFKIITLPLKLYSKNQEPITQSEKEYLDKEDEEEETEEEKTEILYQFCPNCGERFHIENDALLHQNGKCFCQYCGTVAHI